MVDCPATDAVAVGKLAFSMVLRDVDHEVYLVACDEVEYILTLFVGPTYCLSFDAVVVEELGGAGSGVELLTCFEEETASLKHIYLATHVA